MNALLTRSLGSALLLAAALGTLAAPAAAQTPDLTGTWTFEVTTDTGVTTPTVTLEQDGENLTGHYSSDTLGDADLTGTISGSDLRLSFTAEMQGQAIPVAYAGTVNEDGTLQGTIDVAGGMLTGTFTAARQ